MNAHVGVECDVHFVEKEFELMPKAAYPVRFLSAAEDEVVVCSLNTPRHHVKTHHM